MRRNQSTCGDVIYDLVYGLDVYDAVRSIIYTWVVNYLGITAF